MYRVINQRIKDGKIIAVASELDQYFLWINKKIVATIDADDNKRVKQLLDFIS